MPDTTNGREIDDHIEAPDSAEQDDELDQAQTVADDAIRGLADEQAEGESEKAPSSGVDIVPEDAQDVVDHMNQMERSGVIDYDAYRGERSDDDEASTFGRHDPDDHTIRLSDE